ncbi:hypothetical protein [Subtercola vilae]|uniref:Uncharacterized protein n=1 Tax=Subtercola vilae TaxID=2056433 RepID=A0A4T2BVI7_9MICO|nr:hypothetical protein [Subtercola vilae]TIH33806.1 hypothetical protein D4765_14075 [Subtercola vilae]
MSTTLESILRDQMVTYLVSRSITCPITGKVLDTRTCVTVTDRDGDPSVVLSPKGCTDDLDSTS